jgi:hypothetical protein
LLVVVHSDDVAPTLNVWAVPLLIVTIRPRNRSS